MLTQSVLLIRSDEVGWTDLYLVLESLCVFRIVGDALDREQAFRLAAAHHPNVILIGETVEGACAASLLARLRRGPCPMSKVIVFAHRLDPDCLRLWMHHDLHIAAYMLWSDVNRRTLERCLTLICESDFLIVSETVARSCRDLQRQDRQLAEPRCRLSRREQEVLPWLARWELDYQQIGEQLHIAPGTVKAHVRHMSEKLDVAGGRREVVTAAYSQGLLSPIPRS